MSTWKPLVVEDLTAPKPVMQGGMRIGISLSPLAGAVAVEGGVGITSTIRIGLREPDFKRNPLKTNLRTIGKELQRAGEIVPKEIIGFNIMIATKDCALCVKEAVETGAGIVISGAGLLITLPELVQGAKTKIAPIVSPAKSAMVILEMWDRKYQVVLDLVVIEGPLAGGHLGFSVEQLEEIRASSENREETCRQADYDEEVRSILKVIKEYTEKYGKKIPVVTAGGIYNHEDVLHQMELEVEGIQVAMRFVMMEECGAPETYEQAYIHARQGDIVITKSPVGMPGRAIRDPFSNLASKERQPIEHCYQYLERCDHKTIPYCITRALVNAAEGGTDRALAFCGSSAYRAGKIETVADVLNDLLGDAHWFRSVCIF